MNLGDLKPDWQSECGGYAVFCGDCLDILPKLPDGCVDCVVTDPPYGISLSNHAAGKERRDRDWTIAGDDSQDCGCRALEWADDRQICTVAFASPALPWPGQWRSRLVWHKHGLGMGGDRRVCWKSDWEMVQVRHNGPLSGTRESSVLTGFDIRPSEFEFHPCQKSVSLLMYLIQKVNTTTVLDPFAGSGTTGVACVKTGRKFIGVELERKYFDIAVRRMEEAIEQHNGGPMFADVAKGEDKLFGGGA